jgi:myo-inositol-1-phosphate synthase
VQKPSSVLPATGNLGVLLPGLGAVATTAMAGVMLARRGLAEPVGSLTQMGTIRLGSRLEGRSPKISELVPLASMDDIVFAGWDIFTDDAYESACKADVLDGRHLAVVGDELRRIRPMAAVFDNTYVRRIDGPNVKRGATKADLVEQVQHDIRAFKKRNESARAVAVWCGSTETYIEPSAVHESIATFEDGLSANDPRIASSQIYAWACIKEGVPFANGAPNLTVDFPAVWELARERQVPIAGKDFKTGQTLLKTVIAPGLKARMLGVRGWFSTNILGNRDGEVLDEPGSFRTKEVSKLGSLETIFQPGRHPELYGDLYHKVRIEYYPPRGDAKESWDNIDLFGWLGYPMQLKMDFLCRDSILAAPIVLDLALFLDFAQRAGLRGIQEWLSFYFKSPMVARGLSPEHDLFIQLKKLKNTLRFLMGEELITHLGAEYYD